MVNFPYFNVPAPVVTGANFTREPTMGAFFEDNASFVMFSQEHLVVLLVVVVLTALLPLYAVWRLSSVQQLWLGRAMAVAISAVLIVWTGIAFTRGQYDWREDLPIQLCYFLSLLLPIFAWRPKLHVHEVLYYWILSGTLQANLTPRLEESFPHYDFLYYWVTHSGLLVYIVYVTVTQRLYPTKRGILRAFVWLNVFAAAALLINIVLGTNYLYVMAKPPTASLLDFFGPWPWYIFVAEGAALVLFVLSYLPFAYLMRKR